MWSGKSSRSTAASSCREALAAGAVARYLEGRLMPVLLDAGRPETGQTVRVDRDLPAQEFVDCQCVARARVFQRQQPAADRRDHFGLAANDPAARAWRRQIGDCQRTAV